MRNLFSLSRLVNMKIMNFLTILVSILFLDTVYGVKDCTQKLHDMDKAVEKALLFTNPEVRPYKSANDFNSSFCA